MCTDDQLSPAEAISNIKISYLVILIHFKGHFALRLH